MYKVPHNKNINAISLSAPTIAELYLHTFYCVDNERCRKAKHACMSSHLKTKFSKFHSAILKLRQTFILKFINNIFVNFLFALFSV